MAQETAKTPVETPVKSKTRKAVARKTTATSNTRKAATRKATTASKTKTTRKPAAKKASKAQETRTEQVSESVKEVVYAQLGLIGRFYDNVSEVRGNFDGRIQKVRKDAPKQWKELVKRGEKVERDLRDSQGDLQQRVENLDIKADLEDRVEKVRETVSKVRDRFKNAA